MTCGIRWAAASMMGLSCFLPLFADTFGTGDNQFDMEFVTIDAPGNPKDVSGFPNPAGSVPYTYRIGKYEISEQMIDKANAATAGTASPLGITKVTRGPNKPASGITWIEAARFVNWLNVSSGYAPAYKFGTNPQVQGFELWLPTDPGFDPNNLFRNRLANYVLPSTDEWYKAAYYDSENEVYYDYPTGSDIPPTPVAQGTEKDTAVFMQEILGTQPADITQAGGLSPFGTMAQGGNIEEWQETQPGGFNYDIFARRTSRGGGFRSDLYELDSSYAAGNPPTATLPRLGFRVASIPEPNTGVLGVFVIFIIGRIRRRAYS